MCFISNNFKNKTDYGVFNFMLLINPLKNKYLIVTKNEFAKWPFKFSLGSYDISSFPLIEQISLVPSKKSTSYKMSTNSC